MALQYDKELPAALAQIQRWFASIITRPIDGDSKMMPISPSGIPMMSEASEYIAPSPFLKPHERMELYNQQYWWRLFSAMQEAFPLLARLFGLHDFNNAIAMPYLLENTPDHWSLFLLGHRLPGWLEESYHREDRELVLAAAQLDDAFCRGYLAVHVPMAKDSYGLVTDAAAYAQAMLEAPMHLQQHCTLFSWPWDLMAFRIAFLKQEPDHWVDNDFPSMDKAGPFCYILYRNRNDNMAWELLAAAEHKVLALFSANPSIALVCQALESCSDEALYAEISANLEKWIQKWLARGWLTKS